MHNTFNPIRASDTVTAAMVARIIDGLRHCTLPKPEWTHQAHLTAATALLDEFGLAGAEAQMPQMIRDYNLSTGVANTDTEGYHHTLTLFFLRQIDRYLEPFATAPLAERVTRLVASPLTERAYPMTYYSRDRLFSIEARHGWLPPDLKDADQ